MITINLLPEDLRRRERTPVRIFIATLAAASIVTGLGGTFAYMWFGKLASAEETAVRLKEDREALEPQLKHHAALVVEITENEKWQQTLRELRNGKIQWGRKLDQFIDLVSQTGDLGKYLVWLEDLSIIQQIDSKQSGGVLSAKGMSNTDDVGKVAMFITDLQQHDFFKDFHEISVPSQKVPDSGGAVVEFPMSLTLAVRETKKAAAPAPANNNNNTAKTPAPPAGK